MGTAFAAVALLATVTFVSPQQSGQAVGVQPIEITTTTTAVDRVDFYVDGALIGVARKPPYRILHDFGSDPAGHEITATVSSNGYRDTETARVVTASLTAGEVLNVDLVEVPLRVRASRTLRAEDLRVRENGVEQTIRDLRPDRGPARFVFVIDRSLSMSGGKLDAALRAVDEERSQLRAGDTVQVVLFNHLVSRVRTIGPRDRVREVFGDISASGGTSLRDAVTSVASGDRSYVIVITDGGDRNSVTTQEQALRSISRTKTVVEAIVLGSRSTFLESAAKNTGGAVAKATTATVQRELHRILVDINSRYTLAYQSQGNRSGWRAIEIDARRRDVAILNARRGYFAE